MVENNASINKELRSNALEVHRFTNPTQVGDGSTAIIYRASDSQTGEVRAIKLYKPDQEQKALAAGQRVVIDGQEFVRGTRDYEVAVMVRLDQVPHVARLSGITNGHTLENGIWIPQENAHGLVREWVEGKSLLELYKTEDNPEIFEKIIKQYIEAVIVAAKTGFSFGDIKPDDIIFDDSRQETRVVDLNYAEPLSADSKERIYQWNKDLTNIAVKLKPVDFDADGNPIFDRRPVSALLRDISEPQPHKLYEVDEGFLEYEVIWTLKRIADFRKQAVEKALERLAYGNQIGLDLSSAEGFIASLQKHPQYGTAFRTFFD